MGIFSTKRERVTGWRRVLDYEYSRLPNAFLAEVEKGTTDWEDAVEKTGLSIGYPAWNLLYYAARCSLRHPDPVVLETGTNQGFSTIVLAQVLENLKAETKLVTCDFDAEIVEKARGHVAKAGLMDRVDFRVGDSLEIIRALIADTKRLDFVFLDGCHETDHVVAEFKLVHKTVNRSNGTVYFDNTSRGDVAKALEKITRAYGGNLVRFDNCSWAPPGNAIWQP